MSTWYGDSESTQLQLEGGDAESSINSQYLTNLLRTQQNGGNDDSSMESEYLLNLIQNQKGGRDDESSVNTEFLRELLKEQESKRDQFGGENLTTEFVPIPSDISLRVSGNTIFVDFKESFAGGYQDSATSDAFMDLSGGGNSEQENDLVGHARVFHQMQQNQSGGGHDSETESSNKFETFQYED